jgi:uncharacterized membrane protein YphA (DoxX/SURF4 family)
MPTLLDRLALRAALAFIWLATGLGVLHAYYRQIGEQALTERGLPGWLMYAACAFEVALGLRVLLGRAAGWLALLQATMIVGFTIVLALPKPQMLYDPYGVLTKNVPLLALVGTNWLVEREGWSRRAVWLLRVGMASIWLLEALLPNLIFHAPEQRQVLAESGLVFGDLDTMMFVAGVAQIASFFAALLLWGWPLRLLLAAQALGLVAICVLVTRHDPVLWFHPFGPLTKNVSILIGTLAVLRVVR